jgi:hypothetical protein
MSHRAGTIGDPNKMEWAAGKRAAGELRHENLLRVDLRFAIDDLRLSRLDCAWVMGDVVGLKPDNSDNLPQGFRACSHFNTKRPHKSFTPSTRQSSIVNRQS